MNLKKKQMETKQKRNIHHSESIYMTLQDVVRAFLAFEYGAALFTVEDSHMYPGYIAYMGDGFSMITAKPVGHNMYQVKSFRSQEVPDQHVVYSLDDIKKMFLAYINKQPITFKHLNPNEGVDAFEMYFGMFSASKHAWAGVRRALFIIAEFMYNKERLRDRTNDYQKYQLSIGEVSRVKRSDLTKYRNVGKKTLDHLDEGLAKYGLKLQP